MARFGAVVTAMVTPFDDEEALDLDAAGELARWLVDHGSEGLVVGGTTGEGPVLSDGERTDLWRAVVEAVTVPVIAGTGTNDTPHSMELTRAAERCGAAGALVVTPYYSKPSQTGIEAHFRAVAGATGLPTLLYDIPARTGRKVAPEVLVRLAVDVPNIVGVKDAANDVAATARLVAAVPPEFEVYSGNDDQTLALLAVGAVGVVGVATHWAGEHVARMIAAASAGDLPAARAINAQLFESYDFESTDLAPNPVPAKAMLRVLGHRVGQCRPPHDAGPPQLESQAKEILNRLA